MMDSITGIKLISAATVFGTAAVIFTSVPFVLVILRGIVRSKDRSTGGGNFLSVVLLAFVIHAVCTICFVATMYVLDGLNSGYSSKNYYTDTLFNIFWAEDSGSVFSEAGVKDTSQPEAKAAYTTLSTVKTFANLFYTALPLIVILGAMAYGVSLATKDTYRQDYLTVIIYSGISMTAAMVLYIAWAFIANQGLFLPGDGDLFNKISSNWQKMLGIE